MYVVDLTRPCDACGKPIGGGFHHCPKCDIWYCDLCVYYLIRNHRNPYACPMCGGKFYIE